MADQSRPWTESAFGVGRAAWAAKLPALAPAARRALALGIVALTGSWLGYYLITPLPFLELEAFRATVALHIVTGLVFLPYLASLVVSRRLPGGSVLDGPIMALLAVYLLTTVTSLDWRVSLEVSLTVLMAVGIFYVLSDGKLLKSWQVETALVLAAFAAAAKTLWVVGNDYVDWLQLTDAVRGGLSLSALIPPTVPKVHDVGDHPNLLGAVLAMSLPFSLVAVFRSMRAPLRVVAALATGAILLAVFLSVARSAWLAAAAGTLTTTVLLVAATPGGRGLLRRLRPSSAIQRWLLAGFALAVVAIGALLVVYLVQSVEARPLWLFRESDEPRWDVMQAGAEMVSDEPLLGTGPGVYSLLYPEYSGQHPNHAFHSHNGFLQASIDMGAVGVVALVALVAAVGWLLVRGLRRTEGPARLSVIACAGALVAFATFSLFDAPNGFKGPLTMLAAVGAVAVLSVREGVAPVEQPAGRPSRWRRLAQAGPMAARILVPVTMAGLLIAWGRLDIGHYHFSNSLSNANAQNWSRALEEGQRAVDLDPEFAIYRLQLGAVQGQAYLALHDPALLRDALRDLERGLELEPRSAIGHANMALLLAEAGERDRAESAALAALEFVNSDPLVALAAGTALEASNRGNGAVRAYARALTLDPALADSPFWNETPFRSTRFSEIVESSSVAFNPCRQLRVATAEQPAGPLSRDDALAGCEQRVRTNPGNVTNRVLFAEALIEDGELDAARGHLDHVLARQPDFGPARTALGRWFAARESTEQARNQWLRAAQLGELDALVLLGDSYPAEQAPAEVVETLRSELRRAEDERFLVGILYYRFKFFRASPVTFLLPGEWQEAVPGPIARAEDALARWTGEAS